MSASTLIQLAFENVAAHISNIDAVRDAIDRIVKGVTTSAEVVTALEEMSDCEDVTLKTDLRILLNEVRHILARESYR